jgi:beta-mannosidase
VIGAWRIRDFDPGTGKSAGAAEGQGGDWIAAEAPGDTYLALIAAGQLAHPYAARNEAAAAWVRDREWWWHATLELPEEAVELVFEGLDTFADVYLDGRLLGSADNMFREWRFDLSDVAAGGHDLAVCFHPAALMTGTDPLPFWGAFADRISKSRRTMMRKAQFGWGWDWGPDLPTIGIWQPVRIEQRGGAVVRSLNFTTLSIAPNAQTVVDINLSEDAEVTVELLNPDGKAVAVGNRYGSGRIDLVIDSPQLWWTNGFGAQPLYTVVAYVAGAPEYRRQVGIRTIAIDQSPDPEEPGTTFFRFVLNGVPIFAKGANWVPASSFVAAIQDDTYRDLLERAASANMNMIRVWGGGIHEPDIFYDECDRLGLLVWQDFMFACAPYPEHDAAFVDNIRQEVREQVSRLRQHACLALWCGNNENQALQWFDELKSGERAPLAGALYYDQLIPGELAALDPNTPYWPGSPLGGPTPNSMSAGDVHNWTVWHGIPYIPDDVPLGAWDTTPENSAFTRYAEDKAKFVSEFGLQGAADMGTLRRWMAPEDLQLGSEGLLARIKDIADKASSMMIPVTGLPQTFADFVDFTQLAQAEGMKFGIEHYRRRMPHTSGALIWQLNDCWPCVSWSLIDYDGVAKASWFATKRAFAPVLASFRREGNSVELWVTNDTLNAVSDTATVALAALENGNDWQAEVPFTVPANTSLCVWRGAVADSQNRVLTVRGRAFPANRVLLAAVKDLRLNADPGLTVKFSDVAGGVKLTTSTLLYALGVRLWADDPKIRFEDNHFDLAGGEARVIMVTHADGQAVPREAIEVSCWNTRAA